MLKHQNDKLDSKEIAFETNRLLETV